MLRSFRTSWDDKLKWLCKHIIFPLCVSIFNFSLNPPVASQLPPLQREANPHKPQKVNTKIKRKRISWINNCTPSRDCHEPSVLAMTVWVVCGCLYNEILTPSVLFIQRKIKEFTTLYHIRHCEGQRPVAIHQPPIANTKTENKKKSPSMQKQKIKRKRNHYI